MTFDADSYLSAMRRPELRLNGQTYTGRLLGFNDALRFQQRLANNPDLASVPDLVREICQALDLPADLLLDQPPALVLAALTDFFECLMGSGASPPPPPSPRSGKSGESPSLEAARP